MKLDKVNWTKVLTGAAIAGAGAAMTYLTQWASGADFGAFGPLVTAVLSVGVNFIRKLKQGEDG